MFTPPPSPRSGISKRPEISRTIDLDNDASFSHPRTPIEDPEQRKKSVGRQTRWTILLVPFVLIAITASTRYLVHPVAFDLFASGPWKLSWKPVELGKVHQRHEYPHPQRHHKRDGAWSTTLVSTASVEPSLTSGQPLATGATTVWSGTGTSSAASPTTTPINAQPIPTIPSSPPTLPTPFPQPFSAGIPGDNMSVACLNFFNNMTNSLSFRQCRPFSLLLQSSDDLIMNVQAEANLTSLNNLLWGTCNTTPGKDACVQNMALFAQELQNGCQRELQAKVQPIVTDTLVALEAYSLMYDSVCSLADPTTNSYCFVNAAHNSNPSDLYLYQLPIGNTFPPTATPTCSSCSKSLLALYWSALTNKTESLLLKTLATTYNTGAKVDDTACHSDFASTSAATTVHELPFVRSFLVLPLVLGFWCLRTLLL